MMRSACGSILTLLLLASAGLAQTPASCERSPTVEVGVWRGQAAPDVAAVPEQICVSETDSEAMDESPELVPAPWGVPGLEEIAALVLSAPEVGRLSDRSVPDPEQPTVVPSGPDRVYPMAPAAPRVRTVIVTPAAEGQPERILHLTIFEASPGYVDVVVQSGTDRPVRLSWTRTPAFPEWEPA